MRGVQIGEVKDLDIFFLGKGHQVGIMRLQDGRQHTGTVAVAIGQMVVEGGCPTVQSFGDNPDFVAECSLKRTRPTILVLMDAMVAEVGEKRDRHRRDDETADLFLLMMLGPHTRILETHYP